MKLMKNRTLVIGDIHGGFLALIQVLERAQIKSTDQLIFLGDYVDGWSQSPEVINLLLELEQTNRCIFMGGNHESLLEKWLKGAPENEKWIRNGGGASIAAYSKLSKEERALHLSFFERLLEYHIDDKNRLFIHAGFTNPKGLEAEAFPVLFRWDRTLWETALSLDPRLTKEDNIYPARLKLFSELFIGHTPVTHWGLTTPTLRGNVWNLDTGAAFTGKISIMDVDSYEYWQSDPLPQLYPNEPGRTPS